MHILKNTHIALFALGLMGLVGLNTPSFAQNAPSQDLLLQPGGLPPAASLPMPQPQSAPTALVGNAVKQAPRPTLRAQVGEPCPSLDSALASSPDDMAKVQEEIDRFTLCVQRAQLLERLNDTASKVGASYDAALGLKAVPGLPGAQQTGALEPLNDPTLAGADVTPLPGAPRKMPTAEAADTQAQKAHAPILDRLPKSAWMIREITGAGNNMRAVLVSPAGDEVRVKPGQALPDDSGVVVRVSAGNVMVRKNGHTKPIDWERQ